MLYIEREGERVVLYIYIYMREGERVVLYIYI